MKLSSKIGLSLFIILASALSMTTVLNYLRFDQTLHTLLTQRMNVIVNETSQDILAVIDLGLRLENMENLQPILTRRLQMANNIQSVAVLDCDGMPISAATKSPDDQSDQISPAGQMTTISARSKDRWIDFVPGHAIAGQILRDSLGLCAGQLIVTANSKTSDAKIAHAWLEMWKSAAIGMVMIIPTLGVLFVLMRRRHRVFEELNEDLARAIAGKAPITQPHDGDVLTASEIELISLYREIRDQLPRNSDNTDPQQSQTSLPPNTATGDVR
ncbi:hypothetical protein [Thalassospira alkalitolerans]|uniref:Uncharacterized protein n=1 Tax=Thalassospira alkalitolerans TaxID=1293890 RepID=A0A1Y2LBL8_9PROT|nr:hypothetical protein [Thalassospira alkalitolerans]OSQ47693.1 hypothetical protein TALK_11555 [Thalassospira alkalitolerans]